MRDGKPTIYLIGDTLKVGGTERQFVEVACRLDRSPWNVHVSCLRPEGPLRQVLEGAGVQARRCGRGSLKPPRSLAAVWGLARDLRAHGTCLVHSFDFYSNMLGIPAARLARVPTVIASQRGFGDWRPPLQRRLHQLVLRLADYVLVNSEAVGEELLRSHTVRGERIIVIPNGVDLDRFAPPPKSASRSPSIVVGTLANLRAEKGLAYFVQAAAIVHERHPKVRFVVWGEGPLRTQLERLVSELRLDATVELRGTTAAPEGALRELDIFVLPSLTEAASNALMEAMATGLPAVATRVGGNPALVQDLSTGLLVPPADPAALAKAIIRLIEEPLLATELATRGRGQIRAAFGMDRMVAHVEALYQRALAR
jgi:glycosyltransferase involved in cell wall biosynthesis